ncbi:TlpA disulfide reductase family protein [Vibrio sp. 99-70-13A1]|uniref:TlpA family protein disulfide reductase n=1 Tax=Vibrio sp. 99-70-13A1 TaxID=2607601 RepID=UPI0014938B0C|nr:TlpA disulfide reductase family protein [Vibrio sp. 99-70-13A1]NOH97404.1 TlpA family protein disulfide reductase [Vibrio sp. 99-70-13A1]
MNKDMTKTLGVLLVFLCFAGSLKAAECPAPEGFTEAKQDLQWDYPTSKPVTLVNLWAVWCPPCLKELPMLDSIADRSDYAIETIHLGDNQPALEARFKELNIKHLPDTIEPNFGLLHDWDFKGLPATMIVVNNHVKFGYSGYIRTKPEDLDSWLTCLASKE